MAVFGLVIFVKYLALARHCEHVLVCYCIHLVHCSFGGLVLISSNFTVYSTMRHCGYCLVLNCGTNQTNKIRFQILFQKMKSCKREVTIREEQVTGLRENSLLSVQSILKPNKLKLITLAIFLECHCSLKP